MRFLCSWQHPTQLSILTLKCIAESHAGSLTDLRIHDSASELLYDAIHFTKLTTVQVSDMESSAVTLWVADLLAKNRSSLVNLRLGCERTLVRGLSEGDLDDIADDMLDFANDIDVHTRDEAHKDAKSLGRVYPNSDTLFPMLGIESLHLIGVYFTVDVTPLRARQASLFDITKIKSLSFESCLYWETSLSLPSPCAFLNLNFTSNLQAFHLRQEGCNSDFTASLNDFFRAFQGLVHVAVLLEGPASFLSSSCLAKNHGATLRTLVWDQRTGPRTSLSSSTNTGTAKETISNVNEICRACPQLEELGLVLDIAANGNYHKVGNSFPPPFSDAHHFIRFGIFAG